MKASFRGCGLRRVGALLTFVVLALSGAVAPAGAQASSPAANLLTNLRFGVTPTVAAPGSLLTVSSIDPCPSPGGAPATATVRELPRIVEASGEAGGLGPAAATAPAAPLHAFVVPAPPSGIPPASDLSVQPNGSWSGMVRLGPATGVQMIGASCATGSPSPAYGDYTFVRVAVRTQGAGYWFAQGDGVIAGAGDAAVEGYGERLNQPLVGMAALPTTGAGYWSVAADGGVFAFGDAGFYGSAESLHLNAPVVGMAPTSDGGGYWLAARDGGVFAYGDAPFMGSAGATATASPVVGIAPTPDGGGYWLARADGSVAAFGDAHGFPGPGHLNAPVVAISPTKDGKGYWLAAEDGGVFAFGDAQFLGSMGGIPLTRPVVAMAADVAGTGYWLAGADGGVFSFGSAAFHGYLSTIPKGCGCPAHLVPSGPSSAPPPVVGLAATPG